MTNNTETKQDYLAEMAYFAEGHESDCDYNPDRDSLLVWESKDRWQVRLPGGTYHTFETDQEALVFFDSLPAGENGDFYDEITAQLGA